jgi:tripartite-type tricarboxylate transporter receptor subunit TctC
MKRFLRRLGILTLLFLVVSFGVPLRHSRGENYPNRPVNMIVPFAPGGALDLGSRVIADKIGEFLGQPLVSVYKPGGGGSLGVAFTAKSKPDGYTVVGAAPGFICIPTITKKMDYKFDDLTPVGMYGKTPHFFVVKADARWKTLKDFIDEEKKSPGTLKVSSLGKLTTTDFIAVLLNKHAGIKLTQIPFASSGVALTSLLGGHIDAAIVTGIGGFLDSGQVRVLAVAEEQRLEGIPDAPTFKECGFPIVLLAWNGLFFPKGTPKDVFDKFAKAQQLATNRYAKEIKEGLRRAEIWGDFRSPEDTMKQYMKEYSFFYSLCQEVGAVAK